MWSRFLALIVLADAFAFRAEARAADLPSTRTEDRAPHSLVAPSAPPPAMNSIFVFAGKMSTSDNWSTMVFNLNNDSSDGHSYDNYIVGAAYGRDLWYPGYGFIVGLEIGIADRFGRYEACCFPIIKSDGWLHSAELWGGVSFAHSGIEIGGVRVRPMIVLGLSGTNKAIGAERQLEAQRNNMNARVLFYVGPELAFSSAAIPNFELVLRLQHRSGLYGTIGGMHEGYNGNVIGGRYRF
jgi:hypothetical protein